MPPIPIPPRLAEAIFWATALDHAGADKPGRDPFLVDASPAPAALAKAGASVEAAPPSDEAEPAPPRPITSWAATARAIGISEDTLGKRRKKWGIKARKPHFDSLDDARRWYRAWEHQGKGMEPRTPAPRAPRTQRPSAKGTRGTTLADLLAARERGK